MKKQTIIARSFGACVGTVGLGILAYFWVVLGERGLGADANHTSGHTTNVELALIVLGGLLVLAGILLMVMAKKKGDKI